MNLLHVIEPIIGVFMGLSVGSLLADVFFRSA